jgi:hypothetical protein
MTGHFTQLVWKATKSMGCGRFDCNGQNGDKGAADGWFVVCEYWPPGNVETQYKAQVQKQMKGKRLGNGAGKQKVGLGTAAITILAGGMMGFGSW